MDLSLTLTDQILITLRPFLTGIILSFYRVSSTPVLTVFFFEFHLIKWCYKRRFATTSFRATILEHCWNNSKRCRNNVVLHFKCRCKSCRVAPPLNIGDCNICWNYPSPSFFQSGVVHLFGHGSKGIFRWRVCGHIVTDVKRNLLVSFANIAVNTK